MNLLKIITASFFLILFSLGQLQRIQLDDNIAFYIHDVLIITWLVFYFFKAQIYKKLINTKLTEKLASYRMEIFAVIWIVIGLLFAVKSDESISRSILYLLRILSYIFFIASLKNIKLPHKNILSLKIGFIISGLLIAVWGIIQYIFLPDTRFLSIMGWDDHYYRLISTQFDPAFTGMIFVLTFSYIIEIKDLFKKNKNIFYLLLFTLIYSILLTFSRSSYLAFIFLNLGIVFTMKKQRYLLFFLALFLVSIPFLPKPAGEGVNLKRTSTSSARHQIIVSSISSVNSYEWFVGKGLFVNPVLHQDGLLPDHSHLPDNLFITVFTGTGTIGFILFLLLGYKWGKILYNKDKHFFIITLSLLLHSMFNNTLLQPFVFLIWLGGSGNLVI